MKHQITLGIISLIVLFFGLEMITDLVTLENSKEARKWFTLTILGIYYVWAKQIEERINKKIQHENKG